MPKNRYFWVIILLGVCQISWVFGLMSVINFSKWSTAVIISNIPFVSYNFSSFSSLLLLTYVAHLIIVPWFLNISSIFSSFFFTFLLQKFLLTFLQTHCFFSQSCPVYWWGHQISVKGSISTISFWLFLIHPSVYITSILFCMSTFLIRALSLLIILVLNSQCDNSKTSLLLESGSDD